MENKLSIGECVRFGWETFKKRPWFFVGLAISLYAISWVISFLGGFLDGFLTATGVPVVGHVLGFAVNFLLSTLLGLGTLAIYLKAHDSPEGVSFKDLWHPQQFIEYVAAVILVSLAVLGGFILLVIPGLIFAIMFQFAVYLVIDKKMGPIEAMKESARITKGHKWQLAGLMLAFAGIAILGVLALVVGLAVAIPVIALGTAHAYRTLEHKANEVASSTSAAPEAPAAA